jgi:hypothetical protein
MKAPHKARVSPGRIEARNLTLGELITSTYNACGEQGAPKILQLALNSQLVRFTQKSAF